MGKIKTRVSTLLFIVLPSLTLAQPVTLRTVGGQDGVYPRPLFDSPRAAIALSQDDGFRNDGFRKDGEFRKTG